MTLPTLYHKGKKGELRHWRCWTEGPLIYTEYGVVDGALQTSCKEAITKNEGRKNSTTSEQQAELECQSLHTFKLERKYSISKEEAQLPLLLPMLAHVYNIKKHDVYEIKDYSYQWLAQPKLDGVRCLAIWEGDKVVLYSRQGKVYNVPHISEELEKCMSKDDVFDGELYIHGLPLQTIISYVKKYKPGSEELEYRVYDRPIVNGDEDKPFYDRYQFLQLRAEKKISGVETIFVTHKDSIEKLQKRWVEEGYEGAMLRKADSKYLWGYRSHELLKVKSFQDSEFVIVDIEEGVGKMKGHAIMVCKNDLTEDLFRVAPKCSMEDRKYYYDHKTKYIGLKYTVKFFDRSIEQIPRFPVGLAFRKDV